MLGILTGLLGGSLLFFASTPSSSNYNLRSYEFGNGGTDSSSSTNYRVEGSAGEQSGDPASSTNFRVRSGEAPIQTSSVIAKPTLSNPDGYYDRLRLVLNPGTSPSDTRYLIAISSDGFATTQYVQLDNSIAASYTISNYQTYSAWGGASGFFIVGLTQGTTYEVRVRALQGRFTESAYSPLSDPIATITPSLSFGVATTLSGVPPFAVAFSSLPAGSVFSGDADGTMNISSNAVLGGTVYIRSQNSGLTSALGGTTIPSASTDLGSASSGYGVQVVSATQSVGGPFGAVTPFDGVGNNIGGLLGSYQSILTSTSPIFGGTATVRFKAKTSATTAASTDYTDLVTFVAAMNY
jgi:hypothetical protein